MMRVRVCMGVRGCACVCARVALTGALLQREVERGVPTSGETPSSASLCLSVATSPLLAASSAPSSLQAPSQLCLLRGLIRPR